MANQEESMLFTLQSSSFKLKKAKSKNTYQLDLIDPQNGLLFGDRPKRNASAISMTELAANWDSAFRGDPPNAVLSFSDEKTMTRAVFEIKKFKLNDNKISAKIKFSEDQKVASRKLLSEDYLTGKRTNQNSSLFIDSFWNWTGPDSSIVITNNAGTGDPAGRGMMTIDWSANGSPSGFEATKSVFKLANGNSSPGGCSPQMAGSTTDSYDVAAQVFTGTGAGSNPIDQWWVSDPDFGHPWISKNQGSTKIYSDDTLPHQGETVNGDYTYPYTIDYKYHECDGSYDQWTIQYHEPYNN